MPPVESSPETTPAPPTGSGAGHLALSRLLRARESSVLIVLALLCLLLAFKSRDTFYSPGNLQNLALSIALLSTFAIGETVVIITGGIDLSLGSVIAFCGMLLGLSVTRIGESNPGFAIPAALVITLCAALLIGTLHASLIHRLRLPPFIVTLAALTFFRSQSLVINQQMPVPLSKYPALIELVNGRVPITKDFGIPYPALLLVVIAVIVHFILARTKVGRYVYSVGSNEQATRLSGVNVGRVKWFAYGTSALLAGVAGILYAGYGSQGDPLSGQGYELNAVAAAVIGGANLNGGQGSVGGTVLGACLLMVIQNAINLNLQNASRWEGTVVGGVLLLAVLTTALQQRNQR
jgi:ribose transport system permease protein